MKEDVGMEEKRKGEMIIWVSGWSPGVKEVPCESPMRQSDMASSSVTPTPSSSPHISHFFFLSPCCAQPRLCYLFSSLLFSFGIVCRPVLFCTPLICFLFLGCARLILLFTVLLYCPQLNNGNMSLYWQLWVRLSPRRFLSRGSFRDWNTKLKGTGGWIFNKQKHKGRKEKCGF